MVDGEEFARWWEAAEDARRGATVQRDAGLHQWACFLSEQAAELAMKGFLRGVGAPGWGHDLVALGKAVADATGLEVSADVEAALRRLSRHYIPARYPDAHPSGAPGLHYGREDADDALEDCGTVFHHLGNRWTEVRKVVAERQESTEDDG